VRQWVTRFNQVGLEGLDDALRVGRPPTYSEDERSRVMAKARRLPPKPLEGEVAPTCHWTLDRLQEELGKEGLPIKRRQIMRSRKAEHLMWKQPRTWLESDDPECAENRGQSFSSPRRLPRAAR